MLGLDDLGKYLEDPDNVERLRGQLEAAGKPSLSNVSVSAYHYGGCVYGTFTEALEAAAYGWLTADGTLDAAHLVMLSETTDEELALELIESKWFPYIVREGGDIPVTPTWDDAIDAYAAIRRDAEGGEE